ncbi:MAG: TRAP transporter substrate-binding protein DctP [Magnetococcales bacterium]|nr:TRAP transporter substrate-binding protein DctP [Magnetococcales bacterium]
MKAQTKIRLLLLAPLLLLLGPTSGGAAPASTSPDGSVPPDDAIPMRIAALHGRSFGYVSLLDKMAEEIQIRSQGRIRVELLVGGEGGSEAEALKKQIQNRIEGGLTSATTLAYSIPAFRLLTLPLLFTAPGHVEQFIHSPMDQLIREKAHSRNLSVMGYGSYGFYGLLSFVQGRASPPPQKSGGNGDAIDQMVEALNQNNSYAPPSFKGLSVRAPKDRWMEKVHKALHVKQVLVPIADVPDAMDSGWVEGVVSTPESLALTPFPKRAGHYFDIRQLHGWSVFTLNKNWFDALPADLQPLLSEVIATYSQQMRKNAYHREATIKETWSHTLGLPISEPGPVELESLFRPLVFKTAQRLERRLERPRDVRKLWERNRSPKSVNRPSSNYQGAQPIPPSNRPNESQSAAPDREMEEMLKMDELEQQRRRADQR